jgi:hypothetical protein
MYNDFESQTIVRRDDFGIFAQGEYEDELQRCRNHYSWYAQYADRTVFFEEKDDYMKYVMFHSKLKLKNYGSVSHGQQ